MFGKVRCCAGLGQAKLCCAGLSGLTCSDFGTGLTRSMLAHRDLTSGPCPLGRGLTMSMPTHSKSTLIMGRDTGGGGSGFRGGGGSLTQFTALDKVLGQWD